jgi:putative colanic acid biosysnthesis UDP-glucose lipid carrier transferase
MNVLIKRLFDIILSIIIILILIIPSIVICLIIAIEVKDFPIFIQKRNGKDLIKFPLYKFRTMTVKEDGINNFSQAKKSDNRITKFGKFLRKSSIDEIPQFYNVFLGNMSIVGPRPHPIILDSSFEKKIPNYLDRYSVKPGITGLAQVEGFRGETNTLYSMEQRIKFDLQYIKKNSLALDIIIMLRTVKVLLKGV